MKNKEILKLRIGGNAKLNMILNELEIKLKEIELKEIKK